MKVGSERQAASSPNSPNSAAAEIGVNDMGFCPRGPSKIGTVMGEFTPIKSPILRWDFGDFVQTVQHFCILGSPLIGVNDMGIRPRGPP